jgi:hypothetical protein
MKNNAPVFPSYGQLWPYSDLLYTPNVCVQVASSTLAKRKRDSISTATFKTTALPHTMGCTLANYRTTGAVKFTVYKFEQRAVWWLSL